MPTNSNADKVRLGSTKHSDNVRDRLTSIGVPTTKMDGKSVWYEKMSREPSFQDFLILCRTMPKITKQAAVGKLSAKKRKEKAQKPDLEEKKKTKYKPAKTPRHKIKHRYLYRWTPPLSPFNSRPQEAVATHPLAIDRVSVSTVAKDTALMNVINLRH